MNEDIIPNSIFSVLNPTIENPKPVVSYVEVSKIENGRGFCNYRPTRSVRGEGRVEGDPKKLLKAECPKQEREWLCCQLQR